MRCCFGCLVMTLAAAALSVAAGVLLGWTHVTW
jgi:hypothetical protein